jgi:hypothetical protein
MAPGVRLIPKDTIIAIFSRKHQYGWNYFYHHYGPGFYSIGCPLLLRDYTWCLCYVSASLWLALRGGAVSALQKGGWPLVVFQELGGVGELAMSGDNYYIVP